MKKIYVFAFVIIGCNFSFGQAVDWTLNDCASNSHNLYSILDSQEVVVMEFAMGCASCTQAAGHLMNLKNQYDISHPGKVNFFYMDYWGNNCAAVNSTTSSYNFDAVFANCDPQKDDYYPSIYPMPAIVIAAGNYHTVIYQSQTWLNADTATVKTAIDQFFATVGMEIENDVNLTVYPNPVHSTLFVGYEHYTDGSSFRITSMVGQEYRVGGQPLETGVLLQVDGLPNGNYILEITSPDRAIRKIFVKN